jgi:hypothetical protein
MEGDHPKLDTSELLDLTGIKQFQSLIGSAQWAVQLGRLNITTAVMTMSSFRAAPQQGHLTRAKRIIKYLVKTRNAAIRVRTDLPDLPDPEHDWSYLVYEGAKEIIPNSAPDPLGRQVKLISYVDANLFHNVATGRSVTGILHMIKEYRGDSHVWVRVHCGQDSCGTNDQQREHPQIPRSTNRRQEFPFR